MTAPKSTRGVARHTLDGTFWGSIAEAVALPSALLTAAYLSRQLGADGYGLFALAASLIVWVQGVLNAFLARTTVRFVSQAGDDWRPIGTTVLRLYLVGGLVTGGLVVLGAPLLAEALGEPALALYFRLFAIDLPLQALASAHENLLVGVGRYRAKALSRAAWWVARLLLIVLLVSLGFSVAGAIVGSMAATVANLLVGRRYVQPSLFGRAAALRPVLTFATPLLVSGLAARLLNRADLFALKGLGATAAEAGFYAAAQNIAMVPGLFAAAFVPLLLSSVARALRLGYAATVQRMEQDSWRLGFFLLPFAALGAGAAPEVLRFVYGEAFAAAAPAFTVLLLGSTFAILKSVGGTMIVARGRPGWAAAIALPLLPSALIGFVLLIPPLGGLGAALTTSGVLGIGAALALGAVHRLGGGLPRRANVLRSLAAATLAYTAAAVWPADGVMLVFKLAVLGLAVLGLLRTLGEISDADIALGKSLLPRWTNLAHT